MGAPPAGPPPAGPPPPVPVVYEDPGEDQGWELAPRIPKKLRLGSWLEGLENKERGKVGTSQLGHELEEEPGPRTARTPRWQDQEGEQVEEEALEDDPCLSLEGSPEPAEEEADMSDGEVSWFTDSSGTVADADTSSKAIQTKD